MIEIRRMRPEDAEAAARLEAVCFSHPWSAKAFAQCAADENVCYLMAWEGEKLVGNCGVRNIAGDGEITNVAVDPACRRQRVGTELMNKLLETGRSMGIEAFTLEVRASNQAAIHEQVMASIGTIASRLQSGSMNRLDFCWRGLEGISMRIRGKMR